jgi:outer membrane protein TolC
MKKNLFFALLLVSGSLAAQTKFESLAQSLSYTRQHSPLLKSENLSTSISHERLRMAWAGILPQVKAFGTFDNNIRLPVQLVPAQLFGGSEGDYAKVQFGTQYNATYGAEASISLINIANWKNIQSAKLAEKAGEYQAADRELTLLEQVTTTYYMALLSREASGLNQELVNASDSLLKAAEVRLSNGLIEPLEYNRVKAIKLESEQQLQESQTSYERNINLLKSLAGIHLKDTLILTENFSQIVTDHASSSALTVSGSALPRYHMLAYRKRQAQEELKRSRSKILPELSLYARYARQSFSNEANVFGSDRPWFDVGVVGLRAEWNLFNGFNRQATIRQASLQSQIAHEELQAYTLQADKELEELRINHLLSAESLQRYSAHYQLNSDNYQIAGEKYAQGIYTIDQYITIYQERVRSQNQYLAKLANYFIYESLVRSKNALQ